MLNFSSILTNKKTIFFVFLLVTLVFISVPNIIYAEEEVVLSALGNVEPDSAGNVSFGWSELGKSIPLNIGRLILGGAFKIAYLGAYLFSSVVGSILNEPITTDPKFAEAWTSVRDLGNLVIVLGFVIVGIATALRIREYEAKKLLPRLILIAIMINFSGLFCGLIIDASNLVTNGLAGGSGSIAVTVLQQMHASSWRTLNSNLAEKETFTFMSMSILYAAVYLSTAFIFFFMSLIMIARYAILIMLYILSPVAFSLWVFPASKKVWDEWWNNFVKWAFVGVFCSFTLFVATKVLPTPGGETDLFSLVLQFSIVLMFLYIGFSKTASSSGVASMASKAAIGMIAGGVGFAAGRLASGGKLGAKGLDALSGKGFSTDIQSAKDFVGSRMEKFGFKPIGSTAAAKNKRVEQEASLMQSAYSAAKATGDTATVNKIQKLAQKAVGSRGAAAMKVVTDAKDLSDTFGNGSAAREKIAQRLQYAESVGASEIRDKAEKLDPRLKAHNEADVNKKLQSMGITGRATSAQKAAAQKAVIADGYSKANVSDIRNYAPDVLEDEEFIKNAQANRVSRAGLEMSAVQVSSIKKHGMTGGYLKTEMSRIRAGRPVSALTPTERASYDELADKLRTVNLL